jgi:restriction endonuclease Mrr
MRPLLAYGQDGGAKNIGEAIKALADEFQLSEQDRSQLEIVFIGRGLIWIMWALSKNTPFSL